MPGPLEALKALGLNLPPTQAPLPPDQQAKQDAQATTDQQNLPPWKKAGMGAVDGLVGAFKGFTGLGDQGPPGFTATNAGAIAHAAMPFFGGIGKLTGLSAPANAAEAAPSVSSMAAGFDPGYTHPTGAIEGLRDFVPVGSEDIYNAAQAANAPKTIIPDPATRPLRYDIRKGQ
jgi:hypothetical protein